MAEVDVWRQLDYTSGRPSPRTLTVLIAALLTLILGALVIVALRESGVIAVRVGWPTESHGWGHDTRPGHLGISVPVQNHGLVEVTIVGIGETLPGLELEPAVTGLFPMALKPGQQTNIPVGYRVTECAFARELLSLPVQIERSWGRQTSRIVFPENTDLRCEAALYQP